MSSAHQLLARLVVLILVLGSLPALQPPPVAAQDTGSYTAVKYDCAPGYDPGSGDANAAFANCTTPAGGVSFTLQSGDGTYGGGTQQTDGSGSVFWSGIPLGSGYSVSESVPNGYGTPWVYCEITGNPNNPGDVQRSYFPANGGNMDVGYSDPSLTSYTQSTCYWFNSTPAQNGDAQQPQNGETQQPQNGEAQQNQGAAVVKIQKFLCDDSSYDYDSFTISDYFAYCPDFHNGVNFSVNGGTHTATGNGNGTVEFGPVGAGQADIRLHESNGYRPQAVYCVEFPTGGSASTINETNKQTLTDEGNGTYRLTSTLQDGYTYFCYWFDYVDAHPNVHIYKYYCAPDFDWQSNGYDYLVSGCATPHTGVYFEIRNGGYTQGQTTDGGGTAAWTNVPGGTLEIVEQTPEGYAVGRVFCGYSTDGSALPSSWDEYSYNEGIQVDLASGQYLFCVYFNVPSNYGTVYLYKYYCEPGFDWNSGSYDYLYAECTSWQPDVYFELYSGSYSQGQTTDSSGAATWSDVPWGNLSFYEEVPAGYQVGRIFCGYSEQQGTPPTSWTEYSYSGGWDVPAPDGAYLYCYVFDVPYEYRTVYLYKYYCEPGFDWYSGSYDYLYAEC
ncbi:MAG: hypothetical protein KC438_06285, partial [Thermomicrobiales bacterium]|nr:hypothetical protein [Thermomicrobiales bacterium]